MLRATAPAKINLFLHVLARRTDGYHELESLVAFADVADELTVEASEEWALEVEGPFADAAGCGEDNLVMKAARLLGAECGGHAGARFRLVKNIPVGGGFGGGSADAAAALRMLNQLWNLDLPAESLHGVAQKIGADVPMCLLGKSALARGIGETLEPVGLPEFPAVLVHPRVPLLTKDVFAACVPGGEAVPPPPLQGREMEWLLGTRNDLEEAALRLAPPVGAVLAALRATDAALVRMSGSGAGCFALYTSMAMAQEAAARVSADQPGWWVKPAVIGRTAP